MGNREVLVEANQGLKDSESLKAFRGSSLAKNYRFMEEVKRQTMTVDCATHLELGLEDRKFRGDFPSYLRTVGCQLQNEVNANNSRCGITDTYDHTRRVPRPCRHNGRRRRNDSYMKSPRNNWSNRRGVNGAVGGEVGNGGE